MKRSPAFTLIELLVVIAIIGILAGLLYPAINAAIEQARKTRAKAEVMAMVQAFQAYYREYQQWPKAGGKTVDASAMKITGSMAKLLIDPAADAVNNPHRVTFLTVNKVDGDGNPINPWGEEGGSDPADDQIYWVKFDHNFDGTIKGSGSIADPPDKDVKRDVVVWSLNPNKDPDDANYVIGSWK